MRKELVSEILQSPAEVQEFLNSEAVKQSVGTPGLHKGRGYPDLEKVLLIPHCTLQNYTTYTCP